LFIDTSKPPVNRTLYARHMAVKDMIDRWPDNNGATAVLEHGANPGLVSHFVKLGLEDIAKKIIETKKDDARIK
jgi:homospermidine synthase